MFELEEKKYFILFVLLPTMLIIWMINHYWKRRQRKKFSSERLYHALVPSRSNTKPLLKFIIFGIAILCFIVALINPKIGTSTETIKREGIDIVFAVDVSKSMLAEDIAPNRLEKSKQLVSQIINGLHSDRIGIVAYAGDAFPVLPITTDYSVAKMFLQSMNTDMVSSMGTSLNKAVQMSVDFFDEGNQTNKLIVLISDGEDHSEQMADAIQIAKDEQIKIISIGVGTSKGGPIPIKKNGVVYDFKRDSNDQIVVTQLNESNLRELANATEGGYVSGSKTKEVIDYVKNRLNNIEKTEFETTQISDYESQFQWFLAIGLFLLLLDAFLLERKTSWIEKLNLFNEKKS